MMRGNLKKTIASLCVVSLLAAASVLSCAAAESETGTTETETLTEAGTEAAEEAAETAETTAEDSYKSTAAGLIEQIAGLSEDEITYYSSLDDGSFVETAVENWDANREDLGEYVSVDSQEVEIDGSDLTVTNTVTFSKNSATVTLVGDLDEGAFTSLSFDVNYTLAQKMQQAALNTVMGLGVVFLVLIFLCFVIGLMKYIPQPGQKKAAAPAPAPAPVPAAAEEEPEEEELAGDEELAAVIAAAVAAYEGSASADGYVVRSIRKSNKNNWRRA